MSLSIQSPPPSHGLPLDAPPWSPAFLQEKEINTSTSGVKESRATGNLRLFGRIILIILSSLGALTLICTYLDACYSMHPSLAVRIRSMMSSSTTSSSIFPLHILGCGPIGLLYASMLQQKVINDEDADAVTLLLRPHHESHLTRHPSHHRRRCWSSSSEDGSDDDDPLSSSSSRLFAKVVIRDTAQSIITQHYIPAQLVPNSNNTQDKGDSDDDDVDPPIRCLLLCTKANDAIPALEGVWERLVTSSSSVSSSTHSSSSSSSSLSSIEKEKNNNNNNVSTVIILSNGALAIRDAIYKRFGCDRTTTLYDGRTMIDGVQIVLASTTHGAYRNNPSTSSALLLNNNVVVNNNTNDKRYTTNNNNDEAYVGYYDVTHAGNGSTTSSYIEFINALYHSSSTSMIGGGITGTIMIWNWHYGVSLR
jgi:hypothetical protein